MNPSALHWQQMYNQVPLCDVGRHFANMRLSPFLMQYLTTILERTPPGGRTLETGIGSGYGAVWLSLRGAQAEGLDYAPGIVERARQVNNVLGGNASFHTGDLFDLYRPDVRPYSVIHHQGVLEHFSTPQIRAALAQQVALSDWVVFSVPSVHYPFEPEFGDERLLTLEVWQEVLSPFDIAELRYYGDPQHGEREHVLGILRGQRADEALLAMMRVPKEPFPEGVSAIVLARNEGRHLPECLASLAWCDEVIVCDMESTDRTAEIARSAGAKVLSHPHVKNFDGARNVAGMLAQYRWILVVDADERVPPGLGSALKKLLLEKGGEFEALLLPFRHYFCGHWMQCLYPGYTAPRVLKNGRFVFRNRLHSGVQVDGRIATFPADNPDLALVHFSFDSMAHYLGKLNNYTDGEAENLHRDGQPYHWQHALAHFVEDFRGYYDRGRATQDGVHGFIYSFLSAFYRFEQWAKLYERRYHSRQLQPGEQQIPQSVEAVLEYALALCRQQPAPQATTINVDPNVEDAAGVVWSGPLLSASGYGEESRHLLFALEAAGVSVAAQILPWPEEPGTIREEEKSRLLALTSRPVVPGFVQIVHTFGSHLHRHPQAGIVIGRTLFETDRLPSDWVRALNRMDYVWAATEFNRKTFAEAGVAKEKLSVIPECLDIEEFADSAEPTEPTSVAKEIKEGGAYTFLTMFDWTRHKGWDVLLRGFFKGFEGRDDVQLILKVWSTMGYSSEQILAQAAGLVKEEFGTDLAADPRIRFVFDRLSRPDLLSLYRSCDAFVLPSRGEGWGRPYMEAMALGLPTIGTNWSGNTAFMTKENSFLLNCKVVPVPEIGWQEISTYRGHQWAEPDLKHLIELMRNVEANREEAKTVGQKARDEVISCFSREAVGKIIAEELARIQPVTSTPPSLAVVEGSQIEVAQTSGEVENGGEAVVTEPVATPSGKSKPAARRKGGKPSLRLVTVETPTVTEKASEPIPADLCVSTPSAELTSIERQSLSVRWEGAQFVWHSLAHVNREICLGLLGNGQVEFSLVPTEPIHFDPTQEPRFKALAPLSFASLSRPADIHVRHFFPPRLDKPEEGRLVLIQPWEYGFLPHRWIEPIKENVSEVWCYSHYVKDVYLSSGISEEKLQIVPLGVDTEVFHPSAAPYILTNEPGTQVLREDTEERFTFLFVGGTLHRKGIDILLDAYLRAFSAYDPVCLIIKDTGTNTVYRGQNEREKILALTGDASRPAIVYLEEDLPAPQLAGLYVSADCLVQPYRGEGFCLPALEALSCGIPVIVPEGGPTEDFVDEEVGWRVKAEHKPFGNRKIGDWDCVGETWMFEVAPSDLGKLMRQIFQHKEEAKKRGKAGRERVVAGWTWAHTTEKALARLEALKQMPLLEPAEKAATAISSVKPHLVSETSAKSKSSGNGGTDRRSIRKAVDAPSLRKRPTISLCMIVKNEERVLGDCLMSVKPYVDEILIVDTGSTDKTVEIAKEHGAKVSFFPWCDDFSAARNVSLSQATGDWLFWMDADDTLPPECGEKLHDLLFVAEDRIAGYIMQVHIPPAPGEHGFTIVDHVKLFRNRPEHRFEGRIHEQIMEPLYRYGGQIERTNLFVIHSGYDYSPEGQKRKRERDLTILAKELEERPDYPFVHFNLGMTYHHLKRFDEAIHALETYLSLSKPYESTVRKVYAMLASSHLEKRELDKAKDRLEQGLVLFPHDPELLFRAGVIYRELGNFPAAEQSYLHLLHGREHGHIDSLDVSITGFKAHHNLALLYQDMGRLNEAEQQWKAALAEQPNFVPSLLGLAELALRQGNVATVQEVANRLDTVSPEEAERLRRRMPSQA